MRSPFAINLGNSRSRLPRIQPNISTHTYCNRSELDYDHAVVIVHTHSDDETGDLFYTSGAGKGGPLATPIDSVSPHFTMQQKTHKFWVVFLQCCRGRDEKVATQNEVLRPFPVFLRFSRSESRSPRVSEEGRRRVSASPEHFLPG